MNILTSFSKPLLLVAVLLLALALSLASVAIAAHAQGPGELDPTFGGTGVVTTPSGLVVNGYDIALQPDGKIVVVGLTLSGPADSDFAAVRYNPDGSLDTSFNGSGIVTTSISAGYDWAYGAALQSDGKILATGISANSTLALVRYNSDGSLDPSFNGAGLVTHSTYLDSGYAVALQADGKIFVTGGAYSSGCIPIARFNADGTPDLTFNSTGVITTFIGTSYPRGYDLAVQPDGKIIVVGTTRHYSSTGEWLMLRYHPDGQLDTTFNGTGILIASFSNSPEAAVGVELQPDGKIMAAGTVIARYQNNGQLDRSFNAVGVVNNPNLVLFDLAIQPGGKIVASGTRTNDAETFLTVVRYNPDGSPDLTFNGSGRAELEASHGYGIILQPDGKIVAAGITISSSIIIARFLGDRYHYLPLILKDFRVPGAARAVVP